MLLLTSWVRAVIQRCSKQPRRVARFATLAAAGSLLAGVLVAAPTLSPAPASAATLSPTWNNGSLTCGVANSATVPAGTTSLTATLIGGGGGGGGANSPSGTTGAYGGTGGPASSVSVTSYPVTSGTVYVDIGCGGGGGGQTGTSGTAGSGYTSGGAGGAGSASGAAGGAGGGSTALCLGTSASCTTLVAVAASGGGGGAGCGSNGSGCGNAQGGGGGGGGYSTGGTAGAINGGTGTAGATGSGGSSATGETNSSTSQSGSGFGGGGGGSGVRQSSGAGGAGGGGGGGVGGTGATNNGGTAGSGGANNTPGGGGATGIGSNGAGGSGSGTNAAGSGGAGGTTTAGTGSAENMGGGGGGAGWTGGGGGGPDYQQSSGDQYSAGGGGGGSSWGVSTASPSFTGVSASTSSCNSGTAGEGGTGPSGTEGSGDGGCAGSLTLTFTGSAPATPSLTAGSLTFIVGSPGSVTYSSTAASSYSESGTLPSGVTFNTSTGVFSGTASVPGSYSGIIVTATNAYGSSSATSPFTITVGKSGNPILTASGPSTDSVGTAVASGSISAIVASGSSPTGTVTFSVFGPSSEPTTCTSGGTTVGTAIASGDATYHPSAGFTPSGAGDYWWYASYGGDTNNNAAASPCGTGMSETVVTASPTLSVSAPVTGSVGAAFPASSITATLSGSSGSDDTNTITFTVFGPQSSAPTTCSSGGTTVGTATPAGNGTYASSAGFTPSDTGDYWWYVSSPSDADNDAATSACPPAVETVVSVLVHNGATLTDAASDAGSGVGSVSYYYCPSANFTTLTCTSSTPWTLIGTSSSTSPYSVAWTGQPANGDYVVVAVGTDNVLNTDATPSGSIRVTVSNIAPSVAVTYPVSGSTYGANWSGTITGTASSNDGPGTSISSVAVQIKDTTSSLYWNGSTSSWQSGAVYNAASGGSSWTYGFSSADLTSGHDYVVTAQATDSVGNIGTSTALSFTDNSTAPTVATVIGQATGASVNGFVKDGAGYYVYANVTDHSGTGIQNVTANVGSVTSGDTSIAMTAGSYTAPGGGSYNYRSALLTSNASQGNGAVTYSVNAVDDLDNTSTYSNNGSVTFDSTAPTGSVSVPASANSTSVSVTFSATDNTGGSGVDVAGGELMRASATLTNGTCGTFGSYALDGSTGLTSPFSDTVSSGNCYKYEYAVSDNLGNQATIGPSGTLEVDTGSPTFTITKSGSNVYTDGSANVWVKTGTTGSSFTLTATESVSGINASTVSFPTITGWTKGSVTTTATTTSVTYTETTSPGTGAESASVASSAGNSTTLDFTITADNSAPTGSVSVPASSTSTSVSVTFSATDTGGSGLNTAGGELMRASATLSNGVCETFGSYTQDGSTGLSSPYADTVSSGNCYKYEYVVSDNVGNQATLGPSGTLEVDTGSPSFAITSSGSNVATNGSSTVWVKTGSTTSSFTLTATESVSGINATTATFPTITGWTRGTVTTTATTASATYTEGTSPGTGAESASVASNAGNSTTLNYTITADTNTLTQTTPTTSHNGSNYHAMFNGTATSTTTVTVYYCTGNDSSCSSSSGDLVSSITVTGSSSWSTSQVNVTHNQAYTSQGYQTDSDGIPLVSGVETFTP